MGICKTRLSLRVRQELRFELEEFAKQERRTLGNPGELIVEWGYEKLKDADSTEKLLKRKVPTPTNPDGNYRRKQ